MAKRKRAQSYFEPWRAEVAVDSPRPHPFPNGVPAGFDPDEANRIVATYEKALEWREWWLRGSQMQLEEEVTCLTTMERKLTTHEGTIAFFPRHYSPHAGMPSHRELCGRVAECVNACAGITDPGRFLEELRAFLLDHARGEQPDERVYGLLSRCIPVVERE